MMRKITITTAIVMLFNCGFAFSESCEDAPSQRAMNLCAGTIVDELDQQLNQLQKKIQEKFKTADAKKILKTLAIANADWLRFRNSHCDNVRETYMGGSLGPYAYLKCEEGMIKRRIAELEQMYMSTE